MATWRVRGPGGAVLAGPTSTTAGTAMPAGLRPGPYVFEVQGTDGAGNTGPFAAEPFLVTPRPSTAPALRSLARFDAESPMSRLRVRARLLNPRPGGRLGQTRPVLRWARTGERADLFNVQLFRVISGGRLAKVVSAFPGTNRFALPAGTELVRGACYVWRVWPYRDGRYAPAPLGISDFCVRGRPAT